MARLVASSRRRRVAPTRIVIDIRPLQEPERTPITADYLGHLLQALTDEPLDGESFVILARALRDDPTVELEGRGLPVAGRRSLPPTSRVFRSAGLTLDSFLLRGAELGAGRGAREAGALGTVYHTAGGAVPLASQLPVVATLLDLAPWELPHRYAASAAARFGHRLRARVLRDAARVIVCSRATAESVRRRLHLPRERIAVVPLAVDPDFIDAGRDEARREALRRRLELPQRYLVFAGHYDARRDTATLFRALRQLADGSVDERGPAVVAGGRRRRSARATDAGPPLLVIAAQHDTPDEQALLQRAIARSGAGALVRLVPGLAPTDRAALIGGALGMVYPSLSEATGLTALEALSLGVPVISSRAGALPEVVGSAGIVVEPRDPTRLATAIATLWAGGSLSDQLRRKAAQRAEQPPRTWRDVAHETREVYAEAAEAAEGAAAGFSSAADSDA